MTDLKLLQVARKTAEYNLDLIEVILETDINNQISEELKEILEYSLELNYQLYRLTSEKLNEYGILL